MGQCNDAYGAIQVAVGLAKAFNCSVNDLPLTLVVSWFEQKAVAVLLTLLALGVKGIVLGPNPPAFVSPKVFRIPAAAVRPAADGQGRQGGPEVRGWPGACLEKISPVGGPRCARHGPRLYWEGNGDPRCAQDDIGE